MTAFLDAQGREATLSAARYAGIQLPDRPCLAPWLVVVDLGDARLQLRSAESSHTLTHPTLIQAFRAVEKILDGRHLVSDIAGSAGSDILPTTVVFLLKLLQGKGLLQPGFDVTVYGDGEQAQWGRQLKFLSHFVPDAPSAQNMLVKARVGLVGSRELQRAISTELRSVGVGVIDLGEPSMWRMEACRKLGHLDLLVAGEASPAFDFFDSVNRVCLLSGTRWLRVCMCGTSAQLGPTILPHQTACYTCFELRIRANQVDLDGYLGYRAQSGVLGNIDEGGTLPLVSVLSGQVALEVMRLLIGFTPPISIGRFYEFSSASPVGQSHNVFRVPRCESCGRQRTVAEAWDQSFAPSDLVS
jgi:bacteriocin biosynthesis cyclodehydratase domain-containing protein